MDEDDLKWVAIEKEGFIIIKTVPHKIMFFKKLGHSSEIQNDALMHCEGLKGFNYFPKLTDWREK